MQTNDEEKRKQAIRKRLQKKREEKYGPDTGRPKEPWEIKKDALVKLKTVTFTGLVDFIATYSSVFDVLISQKPEQCFFMLGEFLELIQNQLADKDRKQLEIPTYRNILQEVSGFKDYNVPDTLVIPIQDIAPLLPLIQNFLKGPGANFLNVFEQYY